MRLCFILPSWTRNNSLSELFTQILQSWPSVVTISHLELVCQCLSGPETQSVLRSLSNSTHHYPSTAQGHPRRNRWRNGQLQPLWVPSEEAVYGSYIDILGLACGCDYDCTVVRRHQQEGKKKMVVLLLVVRTNLGSPFGLWNQSSQRTLLVLSWLSREASDPASHYAPSTCPRKQYGLQCGAGTTVQNTLNKLQAVFREAGIFLTAMHCLPPGFYMRRKWLFFLLFHSVI